MCKETHENILRKNTLKIDMISKKEDLLKHLNIKPVL